MKIDSSQIQMSAGRYANTSFKESESLRMIKVGSDGQLQESATLHRSTEASMSSAQIQQLAHRVNRQDPSLQAAFNPAQERSDKAGPQQSQAPLNPHPGKKLGHGINTPAHQANHAKATDKGALGNNLDPKTLLIKVILERLTGKEIKIGVAEGADPGKAEANASYSDDGNSGQQGPSRVGMQYHYESTYREVEHTSFHAQGSVRTSDGREIAFALELSMSREYIAHEQISIEAGAKLKDPLVINLDARAAELRNNTFEFDLDADGDSDNIHQLASHSGMLALDANNDGVINDGSELFGARTGNGFAELALHDDDANGWIDENDSVFDQLQVWIKQDDGSDSLLSLKELNIGALYLGATDTPFDLKNTDNELQGRIRSTGVYLAESGEVRSLQQIDLVT